MNVSSNPSIAKRYPQHHPSYYRAGNTFIPLVTRKLRSHSKVTIEDRLKSINSFTTPAVHFMMAEEPVCPLAKPSQVIHDPPLYEPFWQNWKEQMIV